MLRNECLLSLVCTIIPIQPSLGHYFNTHTLSYMFCGVSPTILASNNASYGRDGMLVGSQAQALHTFRNVVCLQLKNSLSHAFPPLIQDLQQGRTLHTKNLQDYLQTPSLHR